MKDEGFLKRGIHLFIWNVGRRKGDKFQKYIILYIFFG